MLSSKSFIILVLIFMSLFHFELTLYMVWDRDRVLPFYRWISTCSKNICWKNILSHWMVLEPLLKINWFYINIYVYYIYMDFFLDSEFYSIDLYICICANLHWFNYCWFGVSFEIEKYKLTNFVLFSRLFWLLQIPCNSIRIQGLACQFIKGSHGIFS